MSSSTQPGGDDDDIVEAVIGEGIEALEVALVEIERLEQEPTDLSPLDALFRCFHSIKGNAAMVELTELSEFTHRVEDVISVMLTGQATVSRPQVRLIQEAVDLAVGLLDGSQVDVENSEYADTRADFLARFAELCVPDGGDVAVQITDAETGSQQAAPVAPRAKPDALARSKGGESGGGEESFRVRADKLRGIVELAGDLFHLTARLERLVGQAVAQDDGGGLRELREITSSFDAVSNEMYEQMLDIQKVAVTQLTRPLERIVRDVCRSQNKWIAFVVEGESARVDRRVLDSVRDSLVHMVRNSVDHGIESPPGRQAAGKPEKGTVALSISETEDFVVFVLRDDGKGIDADVVRRKAVDRGLITASVAADLTDEQAFEYIFHSGFSTAEQVTDLSGRGVGMNVVLRAVTEAGGTIKTRSKKGEGTEFELQIPKAASPVVEGLVVRVAKSVFLVPIKGIFRFCDWSAVRLINGLDRPDMAKVAEGTYPISELPAGANSTVEHARVALMLEDSRQRRCVAPVAEVLGHTRALVARVEGDETLFGREAATFVQGDGRIGYVIDVDGFVAEAFARHQTPRAA